MSDLPFQKQAELWGQAYEVLVKRGVLACLVEWKLLDPKRALLQPWHDSRLLDVSKALNHKLEILDETVREQVKAAVEHMALTAYGVGYTSTREYLRAIGKVSFPASKLRIEYKVNLTRIRPELRPTGEQETARQPPQARYSVRRPLLHGVERVEPAQYAPTGGR